MVTLRLIVDDAALAALRQAPVELQKALQRFALRGSLVVVQSMKDVIGSRTKSYGRTGNLVASVRAELQPNGFTVAPSVAYAPFVDQPTAPHDIYPRRARALAFASAGGIITRSRATGHVRTRFTFGGKTTVTDAVFAKHVHHPGTRGLFFIQSTAGIIVDPLTGILEEEVAEAIDRLDVGAS